MQLREKMVDTPTTAELKSKKATRTGKGYVFTLTEKQMHTAMAKGLPGNALMALAAITGAAYGSRQAEWVTLTARTLACFPHDYRWWHRNTLALEAAGLIECERHRGRLPRYRLAKMFQHCAGYQPKLTPGQTPTPAELRHGAIPCRNTGAGYGGSTTSPAPTRSGL